MSVRQTKRYRELFFLREKLQEFIGDPVVRHFVYLIGLTLSKMEEIEETKRRLVEVDDKIFCAQAFLSKLQGGRG